MKHIIKLLVLCALSLGLFQCESDDRFYRPRVPQKLSVIAIIDADDTSRYIMFEKTFQTEYPEDLTDSIQDLSFTISDSRGVIYCFNSAGTMENKFKYRIPDSIEFLSSEKYFFSAKERDCPQISSFSVVPPPPPELKSTSIKIEEVSQDIQYIYGLGISFENNPSDSLFYSLIAEFHTDFYWTFTWFNEPLYNINFDLRESDIHGFYALFPGLLSRYVQFPDEDISLYPVNSFFTEDRNFSRNTANLILAIQIHYGLWRFSDNRDFRIRLLSIPEEMYQFEKNFYTYERNLDDPFSEPVYLKGNIEGGHGIFAICRSSDIFITAIHGYH